MKGGYKATFSEPLQVLSRLFALYGKRLTYNQVNGFNHTRALQSNISPGLLIHTARKPGRARHKRVPNLVAKLT